MLSRVFERYITCDYNAFYQIKLLFSRLKEVTKRLRYHSSVDRHIRVIPTE